MIKKQYFLIILIMSIFILSGCRLGSNEKGKSIQTNSLQSHYFSRDSEVIAIANDEKTVLLPNNDLFTSRGVEWRILNGLRLADYEPLAMPYGILVDSNKIKEFDKEIFDSEKIIYEKASKFPFYKDNSQENFKDNLPYEFGAYNLVGIFDLVNPGDIKYQKYTKECLFANLYPKLPYLVKRGTNGSSPRESNVYVLPFKIQQWGLYGFDAQAHKWDVNEDSHPEISIPSTYSWVSGALHEMVHELDLVFKNDELMHEAYDREIYCGPYFMNFHYADSPFNVDYNEKNGLLDINYISSYAQFGTSGSTSNPSYSSIEDAAESVTAYILLPEYFRERMKKSIILKAKYSYIKENIFGGIEFENPNLKGRNSFIFPSDTGDFYRINNIPKFKISDIKVYTSTDKPSDVSKTPIKPEIKEDANKEECTDSDGGMVIDIKGITGDTNEAYSDVCFIKESSTETTSTSECSGENCYLKEHTCDSLNVRTIPQEISCSEKGFSYCKKGACVN